VEIDKK